MSAVVLGGGLTGAVANAATTAHHAHKGTHEHHRVVKGTVSAVSSTGFTISRGPASITVTVSSTTTYRERGVTSPTLTNVVVGDRVAVVGTAASAGNGIAATGVDIETPSARTIEGTVASIGTGSFTLNRGIAVVQVTVSGTTVFSETGVTSPTLTDLKVGDRVTVTGTVSGTAFDATTVAIAAPRLVAVLGTVAAATSGGFTLATGDSTVAAATGRTITVDVGSTTVYFDKGVTGASLANVTPGEIVVAIGTRADTTATTGGTTPTAGATLDAATVVVVS